MDVVVIAGSPALPLTRSLSLDMERKGFIVYIVCNSHEDEVLVQRLSRPDIQPLTIDTTNVRTCPHSPSISTANNVAASERWEFH